MSDMATSVIGLISGVISIINATKTVYDAAKDAQGQPEVLRQVAAQLPRVVDILKNVKERAQTFNKADQKVLEPTLESCKIKAEVLRNISQEVVRKDDDRSFDKLKKDMLVKQGVIEELMEGILKDIDVLTRETLMKTASNAKVDEIKEAMKEMKDLLSSLEDETGDTLQQQHSGSGDSIGDIGGSTQNIHKGTGDQYRNQITEDAHFAQRYKHTGKIEDIEEAIRVTRQVIQVTPDNHPNLVGRLNNLGSKLEARYERTGEMGDLEEVIRLARQAVQVTPDDHPDLAAYLSKLGSMLTQRYKHTGKMGDLEEAIRMSQRAIEITPPNHPDLPHRLYELGTKFCWQYDHNGEMEDVEQAPRCVSFFAELNDFRAVLDDQICSFLTVTGSTQIAFANTAAFYLSWRWGQKGVDILKWLSEFLLAAQNFELGWSHGLLVYGEDKDDEQPCIELQGRLNDQSATLSPEYGVEIRVQSIKGSMRHAYTLFAAIASQLAWIVAAFKKPRKERLTFSTAQIQGPFPHFQDNGNPPSVFLIKHKESLDPVLEEYDDTCWHQLFMGFNVAVGFRIPDRPDGMRGVELPFPLMTSFSGCCYPIAYKRGFVLKGWQNALFPVSTASDLEVSTPCSALQWHLFTSQRHRLYMAEAKKMVPKLTPVETKLSPENFYTAVEQTKRHFLGLYQKSRFQVGTKDCTAGDIAPIYAGDRLENTPRRPLLEWIRNFNFSLGGGMPGGSIGISTGVRIRTEQERQWKINLERCQRKSIEATRTHSTILFNVKTRIAWMLPQICVVMHLVQAWATKKYPSTEVEYPDFHDMSEDGLERALKQFREQQATQRINLGETFDYFANALDQLQDVEDLKPAKKGHPTRLTGVDFAQLATKPKGYSIISTDINVHFGGNWLKVLKSDWKDLSTQNDPYRVVTLFCDSLVPQPIMPMVNMCDTWFPPPTGMDYLIAAMHCIKEMAGLYGSDPVKLSPIHFWVRGEYGPFDPCHGRSCNRLQNIVEEAGRIDKVISEIVSRASPHAAVVFGRVFNVDRNRHCETREAEQEMAPLTQPAPLRRPPPPPPPPRRHPRPQLAQ